MHIIQGVLKGVGSYKKNKDSGVDCKKHIRKFYYFDAIFIIFESHLTDRSKAEYA